MSELVMKSVSILQDMTSTSQDGISYSSDQITYPGDLGQVPSDANQKDAGVLWLYKDQQFYENDDVQFYMRGYFREYDEGIIGDDNDDVGPVMANVSVYLARSQKAGRTTIEATFRAEQHPQGTPADPRIRFWCEGHFDAAGGGDTRYRGIVDINSRGEVNVHEMQIVGGNGEISDASPNGLIVKFPFGL